MLREHLDLFHQLITKWQEVLNLRDWRVLYEPKPTKAMAEISEFLDTDKIARYRVGTDFGNAAVTDDSLEETAIHELLHVQLHPLITAVRGYGEDSDEVAAAEHAVIIPMAALLHRLMRAKEALDASVELDGPRVAGDAPVADRGTGREARKARAA